MNLRDTVLQALVQSDSPDPHVVAELVDKMIGPRDVRQVMRSLLPDAVREVIRQERHTPPGDGKSTNGKRELGEMVRDPWRHQEFVPGVGWKYLGDLTADDLDAQAVDYDKRAAANAAKATRCRDLAERLRNSGGSVLRDLGDEAVAA